VTRAAVVALGSAWVFWPSVLALGVLMNGPEPWGSTWAWLVGLILLGPGLALALRAATQRTSERSVPRSVQRVLTHFRGTNRPT
jgi:hypothetical protein